MRYIGLLCVTLSGCSGDDGTDEVTDTTGTATGDTTTPDTDDSAHTADTGWTWPDGLVGEPPNPPVPPMAAFDATSSIGDPRGPSDLYNQRTVLFLGQGLGNLVAQDLAEDFDALVVEFQALDVRILTVTPDTAENNLAWRAAYSLQQEVWSDDDLELFGYYSVAQQDNETRLLDEEGNLMLVYDTLLIAMDQDGHAASVLADAQLLWGDTTSR